MPTPLDYALKYLGTRFGNSRRSRLVLRLRKDQNKGIRSYSSGWSREIRRLAFDSSFSSIYTYEHFDNLSYHTYRNTRDRYRVLCSYDLGYFICSQSAVVLTKRFHRRLGCVSFMFQTKPCNLLLYLSWKWNNAREIFSYEVIQSVYDRSERSIHNLNRSSIA